MKNKEFKYFYDEYFKDWSDIETMIFFMKLYSTIEVEYTSRFNNDINDETMAFMLHSVMSDKKSRSMAFSLFRNFKDHEGSRKIKDFKNLLDFKKEQDNIK